MNATTKHETEIIANPNLPTIEIIREFDAPRERVYRAWTDPKLVAQWLGPKSTTPRINTWDCRTGGSWRYVMDRDGEEIAGFFGSFHEARPYERLVQTFTFEGMPDGVCLETTTFEALPGGRTRVFGLSVIDSMEARDGIISSGMDIGVNEGYEKLDALLADQA